MVSGEINDKTVKTINWNFSITVLLISSELEENSECISDMPLNENENQKFFSTLQRDK